MANIGEFIAKGQNAVGAVNALKDFLPDSIKKNLDTFLNGTKASGTNKKSLNQVLSTINGMNGPARSSHFYVDIPAPRAMMGAEGSNHSTVKNIPFLAESTSIPGVLLDTTQIKRYGFGPNEKKPYGATFVDVNISFFGDGNYNVHRFFYAWLNKIVVFAKSPTESNAFEVNYKEEYQTNITITALDETGNTVTIVTLVNAYPIFLGDIPLSWAETDSFVKIPVGFTYQYWKREVIDLGDKVVPGSASVLQKLMSATSALQVLSNIRKPNSIGDVINVVNNSKLAIGGLRGLF